MKFKMIGALLIGTCIAIAAWASLSDDSAMLPVQVPDPVKTLHGKIPGDLNTTTNMDGIVGSLVTNLVYQRYYNDELRNCFWDPGARIFYKGEIKKIDGESRMFYIAITNVNLFIHGIPPEFRQ